MIRLSPNLYTHMVSTAGCGSLCRFREGAGGHGESDAACSASPSAC
jgi:hypothetical protein